MTKMLQRLRQQASHSMLQVVYGWNGFPVLANCSVYFASSAIVIV